MIFAKACIGLCIGDAKSIHRPRKHHYMEPIKHHYMEPIHNECTPYMDQNRAQNMAWHTPKTTNLFSDKSLQRIDANPWDPRWKRRGARWGSCEKNRFGVVIPIIRTGLGFPELTRAQTLHSGLSSFLGSPRTTIEHSNHFFLEITYLSPSKYRELYESSGLLYSINCLYVNPTDSIRNCVSKSVAISSNATFSLISFHPIPGESASALKWNP